jgi:leucyl aminopeptidase
MQVEFVAAPTSKAAIAVFLSDGEGLTPVVAALDGKMGGAIQRILDLGRFKGSAGQTQVLAAPSGVDAPFVVLVGLGAEAEPGDLAVEAAAAHAFHALKASGAETLACEMRDLSPQAAARAGFAARLAAYRFDKYLTQQKPESKPSVGKVEIVAADPAEAQKVYAPLSAVADGILLARDLVSEPPNILFPASFAERCEALTSLGLEVEVLGEAEMEKLGMRTLMAVGQGSRKESQLVVMRWNGAGGKAGAPIAFVGKGVTFDTGGISIKPADGMEEMKFDMGGAAAVTGAMAALATRKAKVDAVGIIGLVENMPDGDAQRPSDIVVSMSGQTVEVINTDAEGRLVLADALWYCQDRFKPQFMVDLATLTGAMIIALGHDYAGLFANDEPLAEALLEASKASGEKLWRMPLASEYDKQIESHAADVKNTGGRPGGSITAALFLKRFVNDTPWAHLDIAPVAWRKDGKIPTSPEGATGFGVRLLERLAAGFEA